VGGVEPVSRDGPGVLRNGHDVVGRGDGQALGEAPDESGTAQILVPVLAAQTSCQVVTSFLRRRVQTTRALKVGK